jgi:hypothetical protein
MENSLIAILGAIFGFLGKSTWDLYWKGRSDRKQMAERKRLDFLERQLTEFYWPLFFQLQKNNTVWERVLSKKNPDDALAAEIDYKIQREYFYPNNEEMAKIIETKYHLAQPDKELENFFVRFMRHQAVFKAIRDSGKQDFDPVRFEEPWPWPKGFFEAIEKRVKFLQKQFDEEIGRT